MEYFDFIWTIRLDYNINMPYTKQGFVLFSPNDKCLIFFFIITLIISDVLL